MSEQERRPVFDEPNESPWATLHCPSCDGNRIYAMGRVMFSCSECDQVFRLNFEQHESQIRLVLRMRSGLLKDIL